jgi:nitric-oxide synthase
MPEDTTRPVIMVGPGTGIAPFRGFWEQRQAELTACRSAASKAGPMWLFFGCRQRELDLYRDEKASMLETGVLQRVFLALSRESDTPKVSLKLF